MRGPSRAAGVVNVGWVPGISTLQTLGREGVPAYAVDHRADALGFRSRHAHACRLGPRRVDDEKAWIEFLVALGDELDTPAPLFALADDDLNTVAAARERLADRFLYPFPEWPALQRIQDKRHQVERARELGIPTPRTASEPTDELGFPVLVKPSHPDDFRRAFGVKAFRCATRAELDDAWQCAQPFEPAVVGVDPRRRRRPLHARELPLARRRGARPLLRAQAPAGSAGVGTARVTEALWVNDVVEQGLALLRGLRCHGVSQVEFKRDPRDGAYKLMEVNPRLWQWHSLAAACGVNLAYIAYRDVAGAPLPRAEMPRDARTRWAITLKADRRPAPQRPPYVDPLLAWDDRRLALAHLSRLVRLRLRRSRSG